MKKAGDLSYATGFRSVYRKSIIRTIEFFTGSRKLYRRYCAHVKGKPFATSAEFWSTLLNGLAIKACFDEAGLRRIPKEGPVVIVANHPFGVLDGILISHLASKVRPDYKVMTTSVLNITETVRSHLIPVYFDEKGQPTAQNIETRQLAIAHLKNGGCVVVFPAGGVSTAPGPFARRAVDADWQPFIAKMIQVSKATVVPVFFQGQNSRIFHVVSHISVTLRHSMFVRELANKIGSTINIKIGTPLPFELLAHISGRHALSDELKRATYALGTA